MDTPLELVTSDILTKIKDIFQEMCHPYSPVHSPNGVKNSFMDPSIEGLKYFEECADRACEIAECLQKTNLEALSTSESKLKRIEEDSRLAIKELTSQLETSRQERCTIENECRLIEAKIKNLREKIEELQVMKQQQASSIFCLAGISCLAGVNFCKLVTTSSRSSQQITSMIGSVTAGGGCVAHLGSLARHQQEQKKSIGDLQEKQFEKRTIDRSIKETTEKQQFLKQKIEIARKTWEDQRISIEQMQKRIENKLGAINQARTELGVLRVRWTSLQDELENCSEDIEEEAVSQKISTKKQELLEEMRRQSEIFIEVLSPR